MSTRVMAPAKKIAAARILVIVMVATTLLQTSRATVTKSGEELFKMALVGLMDVAIDDVITATPPSKIPEVKAAGEKQQLLAMAKVDTAKGDKAKLEAFMSAYKKAAEQVLAAPPAQKFSVMDTGFTEASRPAP
ncbi:hypothetical protein CFC21_112759 [Triticum aestivum]|uniref:Pollen allergen Poa p IX/Phl p VI domain-containing protein n=2 Tax=Triticum aestivum TaxID=4565 RepID=A0A9R0G5I1_WHEAT|nr:hypothetical protein [Triticum aestivum]MBC2899945.1 hypothetical protein [Triticum aestivum]